MRSFLSLKMNCPGVSSDERPTFFVPCIVLSFTSKSFDTCIKVESFSGSSTVSLSPTAFDPGGPFLRTSETTLYHFCPKIESFSRRTFSIVKTSRSFFFFRSSRLVSCTAAFTVLPLIAILVYFISGYQTNIASIPLISFAVTSVFCHTGPEILKLV